jgi:hypothetical protein
VGGDEARMMPIVPWTGPFPRVRLLWRFIRRLLGGLPLQHKGGDTMKHPARRSSLVAVLLLLASVGTAPAECAWVVWGSNPRQPVLADGRRSHVVGELPS